MKKRIASSAAVLLLAMLSCAGSGGSVAHTITFDKNDPDALGTMVIQRIAAGASAVLEGNAFAKGSWGFSGWATSATGAATYANGAVYDMGDADVTLYARWDRKFTVHYLSQTDPAWASDPLGSSSTETIVTAGTAMTAAAMLLSTVSPMITPKSFNAWLRDNGKYVTEYILNWSSFDDYPGNAYVHASSDVFSLEKLKAELDLGNPVIMQYHSGVRCGIVLSYVGSGTAYSDFCYYSTSGSSAVEHVLAATDNPTQLICYHK